MTDGEHSFQKFISEELRSISLSSRRKNSAIGPYGIPYAIFIPGEREIIGFLYSILKIHTITKRTLESLKKSKNLLSYKEGTNKKFPFGFTSEFNFQV